MKRDVEAKSHLGRDTWDMIEPIIDLADQSELEEIDERSLEIPETHIPTPSHAGKGKHGKRRP